MTLKERLAEELKTAMKARDELRLATIRQVRSVLKNREIEARRELDDPGVFEVINTLAKQRRESIRMFREGGREELAAREELELAILKEFLPQQLTPEEIAGLVRRAILESGSQGARDMGKVMKILMPMVSGRADGKLVNDIVKEQLSQV
jgi:uncharacterized protein YqeY